MHKIPATVLSRCQRHEFRRLPVAEIVDNLKRLAGEEGIRADEAALELIARQATGSLRDAQSLFDQLADPGETLKLDWAQQVLGTSASQAVLSLIDALLAKDAAAGLDQIHAALDAGSDARQFARQVVDTLRGILLLRMGAPIGNEFSGEDSQRMNQQAKAWKLPELLRTMRLFNEAATEIKQAWQPGLPLELAFVEAIQDAVAALSPAPSAPAAAPAGGEPARRSASDKPEAPAQAQGTAFDSAQWSKVKDKMKTRNPNLAALLNSVKTRELHGNILMLGFNGEVLKEKMEKPENVAEMQDVLNEVVGQQLEIKCFSSSAKAGELPAGLDSSGMVAAAVRLGGEIVDKTDLGKRAAE